MCCASSPRGGSQRLRARIILALALATPAAAQSEPSPPPPRLPCVLNETEVEDSLQMQLYSRFFDVDCLAEPYVGWCYHLSYECKKSLLPEGSVRAPRNTPHTEQRRTAPRSAPLSKRTALPLSPQQDPAYLFGPGEGTESPLPCPHGQEECQRREPFPDGGCPHPSALLDSSASHCLNETAAGEPYAWGGNCPLHNVTNQMDAFSNGFHLEAQMMTVPIFIGHVMFVQIGGIPSPVGSIGKGLWFLWMAPMVPMVAAGSYG